MATEISQLSPVVTPLYTDVLPTTQLAQVGIDSSKVSNLQLATLINGNYLLVDDTIILPSPCPNIIWYKFTTPGKVITLPAANGANSPPLGKPIWFYPHPDNTQDFDINTADGTTFITNIGNNHFMLMYGSNSNINGTPIANWIFGEGGPYLPLSGGIISGNLTVTGGTIVTNLTVDAGTLDIARNANTPAQFNIYNANAGTAAISEVNLLTENADASIVFGLNGGNLIKAGIDVSDSDAFVLCNTNTLGSYNLFRIGQDGSATFTGTLTLPNAGFYLRDTDTSHTLGIVPGSNLTANRTFTLTTGDAARTLDISAGSVTFGALGIANAALTTLTLNGVLYGNAAGAIAATSVGTAGQVLTSNGSAPLSFQSSLNADFGLTTATSGIARSFTVDNPSNSAASS